MTELPRERQEKRPLGKEGNHENRYEHPFSNNQVRIGLVQHLKAANICIRTVQRIHYRVMQSNVCPLSLNILVLTYDMSSPTKSWRF